MYFTLIEENFAGNLPGWLTAGIGLMSLFVTIVINFFQSKKNKELTEIAETLTKQTDHLSKQADEFASLNATNQKRLEHEIMVGLHNMIPSFVYLGRHSSDNIFTRLYKQDWSEIIELKNIGQLATNLRISKYEPEKYTASIVSEQIVDQNETITLNLEGKIAYKNQDNTTNFESCQFEIIYEDSSFRRWGQLIIYDFKKAQDSEVAGLSGILTNDPFIFVKIHFPVLILE